MKKLLFTTCFIIFFNSSFLLAEELKLPWGSVLEDNPNVIKIACEYDETSNFKRQDKDIGSEVNRGVVDYFYIRNDSIFSLRPRAGDYTLETYKQDGAWEIGSPNGAINEVSDAIVNDNLIKIFHTYELEPQNASGASRYTLEISIDRNTGKYNTRQYIGLMVAGEPGSTEFSGDGTCTLSKNKKKF